MGRFLENRSVLAAAALLTVPFLLLALFLGRTKQSPRSAPPGNRSRIAFGHITGPRGLRCSLKVDRLLGHEFRAHLAGYEKVSTAFDGRTLWFWTCYWEPSKFHFCRAEEMEEAGISPMFRPLFPKSVSGAEFLWSEHPDDGVHRFRDGEYEVEVRFSEGLATSQSYSMGGEEVMSVLFVEYQEVGGVKLPRRIKVRLKDVDEIDLNMGDAELDPEDPPSTDFPENIEGDRLAPIR